METETPGFVNLAWDPELSLYLRVGLVTTPRAIEEVEALSSIYGDEWCVIDEASRIFCIKISDDIEQPKLTACLQIILPADYPSAAPPIYQINAAWLRGPERAKLANSLEDLYVQHVGESILYLWVENVREFLLRNPKAEKQRSQTDRKRTPFYGPFGRYRLVQWALLKIYMWRSVCEYIQPTTHYPTTNAANKTGNAITDRRSTFQPHLAPVVTPRQVKMVLEKLYENKKIASATHNIYAYRIYCEDKNSFLQDCEDDGETQQEADYCIYYRWHNMTTQNCHIKAPTSPVTTHT
ncbi:hypothetical protein WMY93_025139 [Mugilogobius chulae]|uniref:RWD domain-containing protein n=1 Tax=Mugilogobius chulae TaxID=88201 RepID=A0AAW0N751_9GOBI